MTDSYLKIQILYEISMAIGSQDNLDEMLKQTLTVYLRKLNCFSGSIYQLGYNEDGTVNFENVQSLPKLKQFNKSVLIVEKLKSTILNIESLNSFTKGLPLFGDYFDDIYYVIMDLPEFGFMCLTKVGEEFEPGFIKSLYTLNLKFAKVATSFLQSIQLNEKEENFRMFFESMADLIFITDFKGFILHANKTAYNTLGYTLEQLEKKHITEIYEISYHPSVNNILKSTLEQRDGVCDYPLVSIEDALVAVHSYLWTGRWNGTECIYILSKNLTSEKTALVKFEKLFANNPALMTVNLVPDGEFVEVNSAFLDSMGYEKTDIINQKPSDINIVAMPEQADAIRNEILSKGRIDKMEVAFRKKDGSILYGIFSGEVIQENNRNYFLAVIVDNTVQKNTEHRMMELNQELERKVKERTESLEDALVELKEIIDNKNNLFLELEESENKYKVLINNIAAGLILLHGEYFEILNDNFFTMFGLKRGRFNIEIEEFFSLFPPRHHYVLDRHIQEICSSKSNKSHFELTGFKQDGQEFELEINIMVMTINSNSEILLMFTDSSDRKAMESQLIHALKMESIGTLAAGIAHEINTPLQYIANNTNFLRTGFKEIKEYINTINTLLRSSNGNAKEDIIHSIIELAEQKDIAFLLDEIPTAINESGEGVAIVSKIVRAMKEFSHPGQEKKQYSNINNGIEATINISKNEWKYYANIELNLDVNLPEAFCDISALNQVFLNLIINARDAINEKFQSDVGPKGIIKIVTSQNDNLIEIIVADNGIGIEEKNKRRIFDQFFTTKKVGKGTGQGLSLVYNIVVNNHHGNIVFNSERGIGTEFIIQIPIHATKRNEG